MLTHINQNIEQSGLADTLESQFKLKHVGACEWLPVLLLTARRLLAQAAVERLRNRGQGFDFDFELGWKGLSF
jgi:hypothetical protein